jgi:hypothetical protein
VPPRRCSSAPRIGKRRCRRGHEALERGKVEQLGVDAGEAHGVAAPRERGEVVVRQGKIDDAARAVHHVVVEIARQRFPAPQRVLVELLVLGAEVIRAHDRRVAADVAVADQTPLEHGDALEAVIAREMEGRGEPVAARADHDHVVRRLERPARPERAPERIADETGAQQGERGVARRGGLYHRSPKAYRALARGETPTRLFAPARAGPH